MYNSKPLKHISAVYHTPWLEIISTDFESALRSCWLVPRVHSLLQIAATPYRSVTRDYRSRYKLFPYLYWPFPEVYSSLKIRLSILLVCTYMEELGRAKLCFTAEPLKHLMLKQIRQTYGASSTLEYVSLLLNFDPKNVVTHNKHQLHYPTENFGHEHATSYVSKTAI